MSVNEDGVGQTGQRRKEMVLEGKCVTWSFPKQTV